MLEGLLADHLRGKRLLTLIVAGVALEVLVVLLSRHFGSNQLIGVHSVLAVSIAIAVAIAGGAAAGAIVGGVGAVLFVALVAYAQPPEPHLYGIPMVALWVGLAIGAGAAATSLRRVADDARSLAVDTASQTQALHLAVERLAVSTTPDEVARIAVVEGAAALGAEGGWLAVVDDRRRALDYVASTGFADDWIERFQAIPLDMPTAASDVARDGAARFFEDTEAMAAAYPANAAAYRQVELQASAVLPLARAGAPVGMMAFHWRQRHAFTPAERDLARTFADTVGQALERARLYTEVRGTAEALQRSLLPTFLPTFPEYEIAVRYRPASESLAIGGDWYDVVAAHHGQIGIAVGDVGGKGIEAAAIMGRLRTAMRAYAIEHAAPADVLRHLVDYHALTRPDVFATVVYAALDRDQRRLRIASLGHPMPLVIRGGLLVPLPAQIEPPLGAEAERSFREVAVPVHDGDVLVFVTDGVFERADTPWDESMAHLARHAARGGSLPIERLADQLIAAINDDASARDDRALVVVRVPVGTSPGTEADDGASAARGGTAPPKTAAAPLLQSDG